MNIGSSVCTSLGASPTIGTPYSLLTYLYEEGNRIVAGALEAQSGEVEEVVTPCLAEGGVG